MFLRARPIGWTDGPVSVLVSHPCPSVFICGSPSPFVFVSIRVDSWLVLRPRPLVTCCLPGKPFASLWLREIGCTPMPLAERLLHSAEGHGLPTLQMMNHGLLTRQKAEAAGRSVVMVIDESKFQRLDITGMKVSNVWTLRSSR